jgi:hypothetical protein
MQSAVVFRIPFSNVAFNSNRIEAVGESRQCHVAGQREISEAYPPFARSDRQGSTATPCRQFRDCRKHDATLARDTVGAACRTGPKYASDMP